MSSQKYALFMGDLSDSSFQIDFLRDLLGVTNPNYAMFPFRVALIPCEVFLIFLDDILKQIVTRRSLKDQQAKNHKNTRTQRFSSGKPQGRKPRKTSSV